MDIVERLKNAEGDGQLLGDAVEEINMLRSVIAETSTEISRIRNAITETLEENGHLSDGENCTLIKLKMVMPMNLTHTQICKVISFCRDYNRSSKGGS